MSGCVTTLCKYCRTCFILSQLVSFNFSPLGPHLDPRNLHGLDRVNKNGVKEMPEIRLTDRSLRNLKTEKEREDFKDSTFTSGEFGVRVHANGAKRFFVRYRVNGKRRRMMLGAYPGLSLADARKRANKLTVDVGDGKDPAKVKIERRKADTVGALYEAFMAQKEASFAASTYRNYWAMWRKDCDSFLGDMKAIDVERRHIVQVLDTIEARTTGPHMVNRTRTMLMTLFNWAVAKDFCKYNPVIGVPKAQQRERPAERFCLAMRFGSIGSALRNKKLWREYFGAYCCF